MNNYNNEFIQLAEDLTPWLVDEFLNKLNDLKYKYGINNDDEDTFFKYFIDEFILLIKKYEQ